AETALSKNHFADGHIAWLDAGDGAQGDLGALAGVQPGAVGDGAGGATGAGNARGDQFQGGTANSECLPAAVTGDADGSGAGGAVAAGIDGRGDPPGGPASGSVRAARQEAAAEELPAAKGVAQGSPKANGGKDLRIMSVPFRHDRFLDLQI